MARGLKRDNIMGHEDSKRHQKEEENPYILLNDLHADVKLALQRSMPTMYWTSLSGRALAEAMGEVVCAQTKQLLPAGNAGGHLLQHQPG